MVPGEAVVGGAAEVEEGVVVGVDEGKLPAGFAVLAGGLGGVRADGYNFLSYRGDRGSGGLALSRVLCDNARMTFQCIRLVTNETHAHAINRIQFG